MKKSWLTLGCKKITLLKDNDNEIGFDNGEKLHLAITTKSALIMKKVAPGDNNEIGFDKWKQNFAAGDNNEIGFDNGEKLAHTWL